MSGGETGLTETIETLLLVAAVVAMLARRLRLPYTIGLVLAGITLTLLGLGVRIALTPKLIFYTFLPPLVFEAAYCIPWKSLRRDLPVTMTLATLGVFLSAGVVASGMHYLAGWKWISALLFGSLISATDPVSVIAMLKEIGVRGRMRLLVESESILNDGTAAVAYTAALAAAAGGTIHIGRVPVQFFVMFLGGVVCGGVVAAFVLLLAGRTKDHLVEITFTTVAAFGSFLIAEHLHVSGVLAVLTAGIVVGNLGPLGAISERGRTAVTSFWEYLAFVMTSLVFLLIGMREAQLTLSTLWPAAFVAIGLVILARGLAVYPCCLLFVKSSLAVKMSDQHVLFWGGLRGALALALALGLPRSIPGRDTIVGVAFAVVTFSVVVQGITMRPLLKKLKVTAADSTTERR